MSDNWVVQILTKALEIWNGKMNEILSLLVISPKEFKGGKVWSVVETINGGLQAVGYALLVLFFVIGIVKVCGSFAEIKKPEHVIKLFVRFAIAKGIITYGMDLLLKLMEIAQGIVKTIMQVSGLSEVGQFSLPDEISSAIEEVGFLNSIPIWIVGIIAALLVIVLSYVVILHVYGRFFKIYMYAALAPIPLSGFAGQPTEHYGKQFLKSYAGALLEGGVIVVACIVFSAVTLAPPAVDSSASAVTQVWVYMGEIIFNMLILVGAVKAADRLVHEILAL